MTNKRRLFHHFADGSFELRVAAVDIVLGGVVDLDVGEELLILHVLAPHVLLADLRDAEDEGAVHERLPPHAGGGACDGGADERADAQFAIDPGEAAAVGVAVFVHQHARLAYPLVQRVAADVALARHEVVVEASAEQGAEVVVQPAATIVALVHDDGAAVAVTVAEQVAVNLAEAVAIHGLDMDVGHLSAGQAVYQLAVAVDPALVDERAELCLRDGLDNDGERRCSGGPADGDVDGLASLAVEHPVVVLAGLDGMAVNLLDDAAGGDARIPDGEGAALDDLQHTQSVALVVGVEEEAQAGRLQCGAVRIVAGTGVRAVELAQHLAQHVAEVVVVVDMGQEALVGRAIALPVDAVDVGVVELVLDLSPDVVEQILTLLVGLPVEGSLEADGLLLALGEVQLLDALGDEIEVLEVLVGLHVAAAYTFHHQLRLLLAQVVTPEVVAVLEGHLIVQGVAAW